MAIAAVFALAVIGTAGAFGYRALFGGPRGLLSPPPVIKADTAPSKIVPAAASKTPNKLITDRVADHAQDEKLVSREEKPVEIKSAEIKANPAIDAIPLPQGGVAPQPAPGSGVISTEPKKVHTIAIHPDQPGTGANQPMRNRTGSPATDAASGSGQRGATAGAPAIRRLPLVRHRRCRRVRRKRNPLRRRNTRPRRYLAMRRYR